MGGFTGFTVTHDVALLELWVLLNSLDSMYNHIFLGIIVIVLSR